MKQTHISRAGRKAQVLWALYSGSFRESKKAMSAYGLAQFQQMKYSTHQRKIVQELVDDGWLVTWSIKNGVLGLKAMYELTDAAYDLIFDTIQISNDPFESMKSWFE